MSDAYHRDLIAESQADGLALRELRECIRLLQLAPPQPSTNALGKRADFDALCHEFAALHDEFEMLHVQDMEGNIDPGAHRSWRERARRLGANVVGLAD